MKNTVVMWKYVSIKMNEIICSYKIYFQGFNDIQDTHENSN